MLRRPPRHNRLPAPNPDPSAADWAAVAGPRAPCRRLRGRFTLPDLLGLPGGVVAGIVTAAACACFVAVSRYEKSATAG